MEVNKVKMEYKTVTISLGDNDNNADDNESDVADGGFDTRRSFSELDSDCFNDVGMNLPGDDENEGGDDMDPIFEDIKDAISRRQSQFSLSSSQSVVSDDGPQVRVSDQFLSIPFGIQPRASYEHGKKSSDIMGGNGCGFFVSSFIF